MNTMQTVAACTGCGRGFIYIHHDGVGCIVCGSPARLLPAPEMANDDPEDRARWMKIVNALPAPVAPGGARATADRQE